MNIFDVDIKVKIALIDNYDSFTYNLVHYMEDITQQQVDVFFNDGIDIGSLKNYAAIVLSPGPGLPEQAGKLMEVIKAYSDSKPILGICLGHQALVLHFGGTLIQSKEMVHGRPSKLRILEKAPLYIDLPDVFEVARYHSWEADKIMLPKDLLISSETEDGVLMSVQHKKLPVIGIQYHPESIMTPHGKTVLKNWISSIK